MIYFPVYSAKLTAIAYNEAQECLMIKRFDSRIEEIPGVPRNIFFLLLDEREEAGFDDLYRQHIEDARSTQPVKPEYTY